MSHVRDAQLYAPYERTSGGHPRTRLLATQGTRLPLYPMSASGFADASQRAAAPGPILPERPERGQYRPDSEIPPRRRETTCRRRSLGSAQIGLSRMRRSALSEQTLGFSADLTE